MPSDSQARSAATEPVWTPLGWHVPAGPRRLAYADPPYPGLAAKHYAEHPDYAGEVDHGELIGRLTEYDGWALSTSSRSLQRILSLCPDGVRVITWIKRSAPPFPKHGIYGWEPVIVSGARAPETGLRDWLICEPEMYSFRPKPADYVVGAKPPGFCDWLFAWLGAAAGDEFHDLFPGSGAVGRQWDQWRAQPTLLAEGQRWSSRWQREKARKLGEPLFEETS